MKKENNKKRKKRANGEGCIRKLPDGRWEARITDGYTIEGKQHWQTFSNKKQSIVVDWLNKYKENREKFNREKVVKYKVSEWLQIWYDSYVKNNVRISTRISYEGIINNHIIPNIGNIDLINLTKSHIEQMYRDLWANGRKDNKEGHLSVKTIKNIHLVLHKALKEAVANEYLEKNPAEYAHVPTMKSLNIPRKEMEIYSKEEQLKLEEVAKLDDIYGTVVIFALYTGMRKGEILALQWKDIDFENRLITVNKQLNRLKNYENYETQKTVLMVQHNTKTNNSTRKVPISNELFEVLKKHQYNQNKYKKMFGTKYINNNMVFCREDGNYLDPETVLWKYKLLAKQAGIKQCTFHALRHTFASRALESEIPSKVVSTILGHSSVQFTLDIYTHILNNLKLDEINKIDKYMNSIEKGA